MDELHSIKNGNYSISIDKCRSALSNNDIAGYKLAKGLLPAVTFSGVFDGAHKKSNLQHYNKVVIIDIDDLASDIIINKSKEFLTDPFIFSFWKSPSNNGLKILFRVSTSEDLHRYAFDAISDYIQAKYGLQVDRSGSDVSRLCYISYDPDLFLNENSSIFEFEIAIVEADKSLEKISSRKINKHTIKKISSTLERNEKALLYKTEGRNNQRHRDTINLILKFLEKRNLSITSTYSNWVRVAFAVANSFTYDLGKKYFLALCHLDKGMHDEYKSENLLEYCYRNRRENEVTFGTIIHYAKEKGFEVKNTTKKGII